MTFEKMIDLVTKVGFPAVLSLYLLWRWDALMQTLIQNQTLLLELLKQHMG